MTTKQLALTCLLFCLFSSVLTAESDTIEELPSSVSQPILPLTTTLPTTSDDSNAESDKQLRLLQFELSKMALEHEKSMAKLQQEKNRLILENELFFQKSRQDLAHLTVERDKLLLENELSQAKEAQLKAKLEALKQRLELENALREQKQRQKTIELELEKNKLVLQNDIQNEKNRQQQLQMDLETARITYETAKLGFEKLKRSNNIDELNEKLVARLTKEEWESQADIKQEYTKEPYVDGHLTITDRRIILDEIVSEETADDVVEHIHYFNNKSLEYPIFLIIRRCYGGSVVEGIKILEAMEKSQAPVYVVVESFAASMGATIATLAVRSFSYPNAIILHHQLASVSFGNVTQQREQLEFTERLNQRLVKPVAAKMGVTLDGFVAQMYQHNSDGNWMEFADEAVKLKWIDQIVDDIRDTSYIKNPDTPDVEKIFLSEQEDDDTTSSPKEILKVNTRISSKVFAEKTDEKGQRYVQLPRLTPPDMYYLYNPDNYYRY